MKKLALILAIALIAAFTTPVMASDFTIGGQARYEAVNKDFDEAEDKEYFDQRYRVAMTWKVNDNVTTQLRADFAEFRWGDGYRPDQGTDTLMVDRAWVKINQGPLTLTVGQQAGSFGHGLIWSDQFQGIQASVAFDPATLKLLYVKESEGGEEGDEDTDNGANDDTDIYGGQLNFATDAFSGGLTVMLLDEKAANDDTVAYGVHFTAPIAAITLKGGLAIFDGESGDADVEGTQVFFDVAGAASDALKLGLTAIWADDVAGDDDQATNIQDDLGWNYTDFGGKLGYNNGLTKGLGVFEQGTNQGALGAVARAQFAATDAVTLHAKLGYFEPNGNDGDLDSTFIANASCDWAWIPAVTVSAGVDFVSEDYDEADDEDTVLTTLQLTVAF